MPDSVRWEYVPQSEMPALKAVALGMAAAGESVMFPRPQDRSSQPPVRARAYRSACVASILPLREAASPVPREEEAWFRFR